MNSNIIHETRKCMRIALIIDQRIENTVPA